MIQRVVVVMRLSGALTWLSGLRHRASAVGLELVVAPTIIEAHQPRWPAVNG